MGDDPRDPPEESEFPDADDGFHEPTDDTKRNNLITAAIICGFILLWVLYGLRKPLFGL